MYTEKNGAEIVSLENEIKVVGLSYLKCKETGKPIIKGKFDLYNYFKDEIKNKVNNIKQPVTAYGIWANDIGDLIIGWEVEDFGVQDEMFACFTIPSKKYLKLWWNAETFDDLVTGIKERERPEAEAFIKENNIVTDHKILDIEVYPDELMKKQFPEMYILFTFTVKE